MCEGGHYLIPGAKKKESGGQKFRNGASSGPEE